MLAGCNMQMSLGGEGALPLKESSALGIASITALFLISGGIYIVNKGDGSNGGAGIQSGSNDAHIFDDGSGDAISENRAVR